MTPADRGNWDQPFSPAAELLRREIAGLQTLAGKRPGRPRSAGTAPIDGPLTDLPFTVCYCCGSPDLETVPRGRRCRDCRTCFDVEGQGLCPTLAEIYDVLAPAVRALRPLPKSCKRHSEKEVYKVHD